MIISTERNKWTIPSAMQGCRLRYVPIDYIIGFIGSKSYQDAIYFAAHEHKYTLAYIHWVMDSYQALTVIDRVPVLIDTKSILLV